MNIAPLIYALAAAALVVHCIAVHLAFTEAYKLKHYRHVWLLFSAPSFLLIAQILIESLQGGYLSHHTVYHASQSLVLALMLTAGVYSLRSLLREVAEKSDALQLLLNVDGLTGLLTREAWSKSAERELSLARRSGESLTAVEIDIDHFKNVNDTHGHEIGDEVLRVLGDLCKRSTRHTDIWGRLGGEEFACLMPGTDAVTAKEIIERMRIQVANHFFSTGHGGIRITISAGIACVFPDTAVETSDETLIKQLIKQADMAMYAAKHAGRNRSHIYDGCQSYQNGITTSCMP